MKLFNFFLWGREICNSPPTGNNDKDDAEGIVFIEEINSDKGDADGIECKCQSGVM